MKTGEIVLNLLYGVSGDNDSWNRDCGVDRNCIKAEAPRQFWRVISRTAGLRAGSHPTLEEGRSTISPHRRIGILGSNRAAR